MQTKSTPVNPGGNASNGERLPAQTRHSVLALNSGQLLSHEAFGGKATTS